MSSVLSFIIILIIFYLYILYTDKQLYDSFLTGFYKGDSSYCSKANIDEIVFYINNSTNSGHVIIKQNNELIEHTSFDIQKKLIINSNTLIPFNNILGSQFLEYDIVFISENNKDFCWNDSPYKMILSIINGSLTLIKNDVVHAILYKDNGISNEFINYATE